MDYDAIQQAALARPIDERAELLGPLLRSLRGLSEAEIERGEDPPAAKREEALKETRDIPVKVDPILAKAALSLSVKERDKLVTKLIHSLDEGIPGEVVSQEEHWEAWRVEIERRVREVDSGEVQTIPWEEVKRKARELLGEV